MVDVLIAGGGAAGAACAAELRRRRFRGSVLLVGREPLAPYERPPVSKHLLRTGGEPPALAVPADVEVRVRTSVMKLDAGRRVARLSDKSEVEFGMALLAPGANVRRLRIEGGALEGIHYLRAPANAAAVRADAAPGARALLVGGSYIACEVAASLTEAGVACTMAMLEELPLSTHFGPAAGRFAYDVLRSRGVEVITADPVERFDGDGRVARAVLASGRVVACDLAVMGTGAVPDVTLARGAGLALGETGGIACSAALETSAEGVWAAGDACEYDSVLHGRRVRIEHWEVARGQGKFAARAMLGAREPYEEVPYFWSDLADWCTLEAIGPLRSWDAEVVRGSYESGSFCAFHLAGDRVVAALSCGRPEDLMHARRLLAERRPLGDNAAALLADESTDLAGL